MKARDCYFRMNGGPVQMTRVWDIEKFAEARAAEVAKAKPPGTFELSTEGAYQRERATSAKKK